MDLLSLPILCLFASLAISALGKKHKKPKKHFPFPALKDNIIPFGPSTPFYKFDGIDYDELPDKFKKDYYNCDSEFITCIKNLVYLNNVCSRTAYYDTGSYYSLCQLEISNCNSRMSWGDGLYGTYHGNDISLYQGEGYYCQFSQKRFETRRLGQLNFVMVPYQPSDNFMSNHLRLRDIVLYNFSI